MYNGNAYEHAHAIENAGYTLLYIMERYAKQSEHQKLNGHLYVAHISG